MKNTFTYYKTNELDLTGDFYSCNMPNKPIILYIHGGGLLFGSKNDLTTEVANFYLQSELNIFAINYRLAPEATIDTILDDIYHAFQWLKNNSDTSLNYYRDSIYLVGHSAGAFLSLLACCNLEINPKKVVSFYGYGDLTSPWAIAPSYYYNKKDKVPFELVEHLITSHTLTECSAEKRYALYMYGRQSGKWIQLVTGTNEVEQLKQFSPIYHIGADFPPTLLLHGMLDQDVPYEASLQLYKKLKQNNVDTQLITIPNGKHLFDNDWNNDVVKDSFKQVIDFLKRKG